MKVTLIYVGVGVAGFAAKRPAGDREGSWIGHGIASIGASLKAAGHEVDLIDMRNIAGWQALDEAISKNDSEVFGLSVSGVDGANGLRVAKMVKNKNRKARVIAGGIHPTVFPEEYNIPEIDTVLTGEGEITFSKLLDNQKYPARIQGEKPRLDNLPFVDRELFDYAREIECQFAPDQKTPSITMLAGRGCAYHCSYCQGAENAVFGKPFRMRSPENVIAELEMLYKKYAFKSITFWDDTFTFLPKWIYRFCDLYEDRNYGATIAACSRADIICKNEDMIRRMAEIGVDWLVIGLESGSRRILDFLNKGTTPEQNRRAAEICRKYGIKIFGTYMYGLPTETKEEAIATSEMIADIQPEHPSPFFFRPIPGTDIYNYCRDNDLILDIAKKQSIARTGIFSPTIKDVDYGFLNELIQKDMTRRTQYVTG